MKELKNKLKDEQDYDLCRIKSNEKKNLKMDEKLTGFSNLTPDTHCRY